MADRGKLYKYISNLMARGNSSRDINNKIKKHATFKYARNDIVSQNIERVKADKQSAIDFNKANVNAKINDAFLGNSGKKFKVLTLGVHFTFEFPRGSNSGKSGRESVHFTIDVPAGSTKAEINKIVRDQIREWMEGNYEARFAGKGSLPFTVDTIIGG